MAAAELAVSPFIHPGSTASPSSLVVLHLRRDHLLPTFLSNDESNIADYAEGPVTNTRFGSYPHSTLIGLPWGSQVLASQVDTGSRGRKGNGATKKRERLNDAAQHLSPNKRVKVEDVLGDEEESSGHLDQGQRTNGTRKGNTNPDLIDGEPDQDDRSHKREPNSKKSKTASVAASGFCHLLPPTPETWTISLPHRTQVVYTPDYSYILQKMRVRPGSVVLEAGAGSGSFTHAAARAVFDGYAKTTKDTPSDAEPRRYRQQHGRVYSYEYHAPRAAQLDAEISTHGLSSFVTVNHRDVYNAGFLLDPSPSSSLSSEPHHQTSPNATHIFLDLPAPWQALPHLTRTQPTPLDPSRQVHISIFLPCIEQVQRAVSALRTHGWVEISMQELAQRRIDVRRERVGLDLQGLRGVNASPATVDEACARLREVEMNGRRFLNRASESGGATEAQVNDNRNDAKGENRAERLARLARQASENKSAFRLGRLVTRTEPEIRTHTSYLVFAVLPRAWSSEDEEAARVKWQVKPTEDKRHA